MILRPRTRTVVGVAGLLALCPIAAGCGSSLAGRVAAPRGRPSSVVAVVGRTAITRNDLALAERTAPGGLPSSAVLSDLVRDAVVIDAARSLGLLGSLTVATVSARPSAIGALNARLYDRVASAIPAPDPRVLAYARALDTVAGEEADETGQTPQAVVTAYQKWMLARDRVASSWFGQLFRRYQRLIRYAPGYGP